MREDVRNMDIGRQWLVSSRRELVVVPRLQAVSEPVQRHEAFSPGVSCIESSRIPCSALQVKRQFCQMLFVRVPNYGRHARQSRNFVGRTLRVAASHDDLTLRIGAVDATDSRARILVGGGSDRAGIQYDKLCLVGRASPLKTALRELAFQGSAVGLRRTTSEILYVKTGHACIVTYVASCRAQSYAGSEACVIASDTYR